MAGGRAGQASIKGPGKRALGKKISIAAVFAVLAVFAVREFPALRREVKIWLM
ncbi:MAG TPA: hypothetical protein VG365_09285 [Solirubrobacteraceae bacterium]|nr:hypothetical protein [Solirubrobacteraceae bacterium]